MKKLVFAYHLGHFDSLGICQKIVRIVGFVGLSREDEKNKNKKCVFASNAWPLEEL